MNQDIVTKKIRGVSDLAINGAPPAFTTPLHVGHPNIGNRTRFLEYVDQIFDSGRLTNNGPLVRELEKQVQERLEVGQCVAMCNGTVALEIAIRALGLNGEVIVPSYTFIATAHALHWQEITPVFADINPHTHSLDPESVEMMITPKTTGIIGVHLWGRACDVSGLQRVAEKHNLKLMFDAAHAFGCTYNQQLLGGFGACEVLSFHATKCLNSFEGGAVVTNDAELAEKMRLMRNFGFGGFDNVIYPGTNGKMSEISAAMGLTNLERLDKVIQTNQRNYNKYLNAINGIPGLSILEYDPEEASNYQYVIVQVEDEYPLKRDELIGVLHMENVLARRYFWPGCHGMKPFRELYPLARLVLGKTEEVAGRVIVLPTGTAISEDTIETICRIMEVAAKGGG